MSLLVPGSWPAEKPTNNHTSCSKFRYQALKVLDKKGTYWLNNMQKTVSFPCHEPAGASSLDFSAKPPAPFSQSVVSGSIHCLKEYCQSTVGISKPSFEGADRNNNLALLFLMYDYRFHNTHAHLVSYCQCYWSLSVFFLLLVYLFV